MSRLSHKNFIKAPDTYMKLIRQFPLRPVRNESDYDAAAAVIDSLAVRNEGDLDQGERDYLAVLTDLIEDFDDHRRPFPSNVRPVHERLKSLVEEHEMSAADLAKVLGVGRSLASLVLSGKRRITATHAKALAEYFKLEPGYFL